MNIQLELKIINFKHRPLRSEMKSIMRTKSEISGAHYFGSLLDHGMDLLQIWTMKEAYAKYLLRGVDIDFTQIHIHPFDDLLFMAEHRDYHTLTIQSWLTDELAIAVSVEMIQECFSKINLKEDVAEHEHYDDRGSESLFIRQKRDLSR
ncbi:4'-phosphopantetheinyl transferase superfamily protein [Paenibacillus sp. FSL R7-0297]|uniref:4'-phosphopantetheinyl transferase family protein n=1 Tax=unclassified Paenibacillus TaxID=185978 RepID=UPI0004F674CC|nr:4'-phosphopantetheinyl transferase superfamily protein [Paenibacillus sp. FSL R5-0912]AIQ41690.1 hypothetical protein R50912_17830 [Paenibacillus sp. FSL R5-0912]